MKISITTTVENTATPAGDVAEHGLSYLIEYGGDVVLFDTGAGHALPYNAAKFNLPINKAKVVALSHGHYDHTGALKFVLNAAPGATVFAHPRAAEPKYARKADGSGQFIGMSQEHINLLEDLGERFHPVIGPTEILPGLWLTGQVPRTNDFEDVGGPFFLDEKCTKPDPLLDDMSMFFDTDDGVAIILGCTHAGVVNTMEYIAKLTGGRPIDTVAGGMHLVNADGRRMNQTIRALQKFDPRKIGVCHCVGMKASAKVFHEFPAQAFHNCVGTKMSFQKS